MSERTVFIMILSTIVIVTIACVIGNFNGNHHQTIQACFKNDKGTVAECWNAPPEPAK